MNAMTRIRQSRFYINKYKLLYIGIVLFLMTMPIILGAPADPGGGTDPFPGPGP